MVKLYKTPVEKVGGTWKRRHTVKSDLGAKFRTNKRNSVWGFTGVFAIQCIQWELKGRLDKGWKTDTLRLVNG